jgi:Cd2+/Zn2+-exporting ATPase
MAKRFEFRIHGMDCADEVAILRREIEPIVKEPGRLSFDILRGKMNVDQGDPAVTAAGLVAAVAKTGMRAEVWQDVKPTSSDMSFWQRRGRTVLMVASGFLTITAFSLHASVAGLSGALGSEGTGLAEGEAPMVAVILYVTSIVCGGWYVAPRALAAVLRLRPDMHLLMAIAVIGAAAIGEWFARATPS